MKKILYLAILLLILFTSKVYADTCKGDDLTRLQSIANNIKVNYEGVEKKSTIPDRDETGRIIEGSTVEAINYTLKINVLNIVKDVYLLVTNESTNEQKTITYNDTTNGKYVIDNDNIYDYQNYKFDVYSNLSTCERTLVKTITFVKPILNPNAKYQICIDNPTVPACATFITEDTRVNDGDLYEHVQNYLKTGSKDTTVKDIETDNSDTNDKNENNNFFKDNIVYFGIGGVIVVVGIVIYVIISKKRSAL